MRPLVEKLIHKAKRNSHEDRIYLFKTLKNKTAIKRLSEVIAPRFGSLAAGFSRIEFIGRRTNDKSKTAMIELIGNPQYEFEKNEQEVEKETHGLKTFWEWEQGLLD
jgi:hypothetical protein